MMQQRRYLVMSKIMLGMLIIGIWLHCPQSVHAEPGQPTATPTAVTPQVGTMLTTVKVGETPQSVAINPTTNRVYIANFSDGTVSVLDGNTRSVIATVKVGGSPSGIAVNPITNRIYVGNYTSNMMSVLDGTTNTVMASVKITGTTQDVAVAPTTNRIYLLCSQDNTLSVIDGNTNAVIVNKILNSNVLGVVANPVTNRIYIANGRRVSVYTGMVKNPIANISIGDDPVAMAVNPVMNRFYVAGLGGTVSVFDGQTNKLVTKVIVGGYPSGMAVNPTTGQVFVTNMKDNAVSVLDGCTNTIAATVPMAADSAPVRAAVIPDTHQVYITNSNANNISIFDGNAYLTESAREYAAKPHAPAGAMPVFFEERFAEGTLDLTRWLVLQREEKSVGIIDVVGTNATDRRLHMRLDNLGVQAVCTRNAVIDFDDPTPTEIDVELDWSQVTDSRGLVAGIGICPFYSETPDVDSRPEYIEVMYYGEQDYRTTANAHMDIRARILNQSAAAKSKGGSYKFVDEGYDAAMAANHPFPGRKLGVQHLRIIVSNAELAVWENDKLICKKSFLTLERLKAPLPWSIGYLYLVESSGAHLEDMPAREVYFGNISVRKLTNQPKTQ